MESLVRQATRYLQASKQDTDPAFGLTHASYARVIFEFLFMEKGKKELLELLNESGKMQDFWGEKCRGAYGKRERV